MNMLSNNNEKLAVRTVKREKATPRKNPPFVKPKTKPTKAYSNMPELVEALQNKEFVPEYAVAWSGEEILLMCCVDKPKKVGNKISAHLVYKTYGEEDYSREGSIPFSFPYDDIMGFMPETPAAKLEMLNSIIRNKKIRLAELEAHFEELLRLHAGESVQERWTVLECDLSNRQSHFRPILRNMIKFEVLLNVLKDPEPYMQ